MNPGTGKFSVWFKTMVLKTEQQKPPPNPVTYYYRYKNPLVNWLEVNVFNAWQVQYSRDGFKGAMRYWLYRPFVRQVWKKEKLPDGTWTEYKLEFEILRDKRCG